MPAMLGSVVVDEVVLPITGVQLVDGGLRITAHARGPLPLMSLARYVVHGEDGRTMYRTPRADPTTIGPLEADSELTFTLDITLNNATAAGPIQVTDRR